MSFRAGFDVGGTNARGQLVTDAGQPLPYERTRIRGATAPSEVARSLVLLLCELCAAQDIEVQELEAIGIGLAGQLSAHQRVIQNAPNLGWRDVDFVAHLQSKLDEELGAQSWPPIHVVNDLNAQLWGEHLDGAVVGIDDVLAVYVGTGIGGALMTDGTLVSGADATAGEIGHSKVVVGGRPCRCGELGCVEAYAGGVHLERRLASLATDSDDDALRELLDDDPPILGTADALAATHDGVFDIWEEATDYLSLIIANAVTLLNPAVLLLGGGVLENCATFRRLVIQKTLPLIVEVSRLNLVIKQAALGDTAGMLGAADLAKEQSGYD